MTATLDTIKKQILADLESTSINAAYDGAVSNTRSYPYAQIDVSESSFDPAITSVFDKTYQLYIYITDTTASGVEEAIEEVQKLWFGTAEFAIMQILGAISILPVRTSTPVPTQGLDVTEYTGLVVFDMTVRYSYS